MDDRLAVRGALEKLLQQKADRSGFSDSDLLITSGRLDSVDTLELVVFLETQYGLDFSDGLNRDELDSVDSLLNLIATRCSK